VADRLYNKAFKYIVKFPDGIEPPDGYKPGDDNSDYIGVTVFQRPSRQEDARTDDGFTGNLQYVPIMVQVEEAVMSKVMPLLNKPMKPDWKLTLKELGKEEKDEASVTFESELEGVRFTQAGPTGIIVHYQQYESKKYAPKGPTQTEGYNFLEQKDLG
jgi:hypothetical protein